MPDPREEKIYGPGTLAGAITGAILTAALIGSQLAYVTQGANIAAGWNNQTRQNLANTGAYVNAGDAQAVTATAIADGFVNSDGSANVIGYADWERKGSRLGTVAAAFGVSQKLLDENPGLANAIVKSQNLDANGKVGSWTASGGTDGAMYSYSSSGILHVEKPITNRADLAKAKKDVARFNPIAAKAMHRGSLLDETYDSQGTLLTATDVKGASTKNIDTADTQNAVTAHDTLQELTTPDGHHYGANVHRDGNLYVASFKDAQGNFVTENIYSTTGIQSGDQKPIQEIASKIESQGVDPEKALSSAKQIAGAVGPGFAATVAGSLTGQQLRNVMRQGNAAGMRNQAMADVDANGAAQATESGDQKPIQEIASKIESQGVDPEKALSSAKQIAGAVGPGFAATVAGSLTGQQLRNVMRQGNAAGMRNQAMADVDANGAAQATESGDQKPIQEIASKIESQGVDPEKALSSAKQIAGAVGPGFAATVAGSLTGQQLRNVMRQGNAAGMRNQAMADVDANGAAQAGAVLNGTILSTTSVHGSKATDNNAVGTVDGYAYAGSKVSYGSGASQITGLFTSPNGQTFAGRADLDKAGNIVSLKADRGQNLGDKNSLGESLDITRAEAPKYEAAANRDGLTKIAAGMKNAFAKNPELQGMHIDMTRNPETLALTSMSAVGGGYSGYQDLTKVDTGTKDINNDIHETREGAGLILDSTTLQQGLAGNTAIANLITNPHVNEAGREGMIMEWAGKWASGFSQFMDQSGVSMDYTKGDAGGKVGVGFEFLGDGATASASASVGGQRTDENRIHFLSTNAANYLQNTYNEASKKFDFRTPKGRAQGDAYIASQFQDYTSAMRINALAAKRANYGASAGFAAAGKIIKKAKEGSKDLSGNVLGGGPP